MAKRRARTHTAPTNEIKAHSQHRNHFTLKKRVHRNENTIQMTHLAVLDLFHRITANRWNQTEPKYTQANNQHEMWAHRFYEQKNWRFCVYCRHWTSCKFHDLLLFRWFLCSRFFRCHFDDFSCFLCLTFDFSTNILVEVLNVRFFCRRITKCTHFVWILLHQVQSPFHCQIRLK